jgi:hypothetical protein
MFPMLNATASLTDRFAWLFDGLCKVIGADAHKLRMEAALAWAIWTRVRVLGERLVALMARADAGRLRVRRAATPPASPLQGEVENGRHMVGCAPGPRLPREFGWVRRVLPQIAQFAGVLSYLLDDPAVVALVQKAPEAGRILRPLCHLLGVTAPVFLRRGFTATGTDGAGDAVASAPPLPCSIEAEEEAEQRAAAEAPAQPPPPPPPAPVPPPSRPYASRPGGLYWDGSRWQWS